MYRQGSACFSTSFEVDFSADSSLERSCMAAFPQVRSEPDDVASRLAQLGLTVGILHEAIAQGEVARSNCTANHPPMTAGQTAWSETVRALRDQLLAQGWSKDDSGNYSRTIHPDGTF